MIKSQKQRHKIFILFLLYFLNVSLPAYCGPLKDSLFIADSLFNEKKYTQSFEIYDAIIKQGEKSSPAMLLRMAFIKEGLGEYGNALYYLNLYYLKTFNKRVLKKMENLAEKYKLEGYNYDDAEIFMNIYYKYKNEIYLGILVITLIILSVMVYQKFTRKKISLQWAISLIIFLCIILVANNFLGEKPQAIIKSSHVYLMDGPSAGADIIDVVGQGHRVEVMGNEDIWTKIEWKGKIAYVKDFNLKHVGL